MHGVSLICVFRSINRYLLVALLSVPILWGCGPRRIESSKVPVNEYQGEEMLELNRKHTNKLTQMVMDLATARGWNIRQTGTGLFYEIVEQYPDVANIKTGMVFQVNMTTNILYPSGYQIEPTRQITTIRLGSTPLLRGFEEGLQLLHSGDSARLVLLPHLAYGLTGDESIPPGAVLLIEMRVSDVEDLNKNN